VVNLLHVSAIFREVFNKENYNNDNIIIIIIK